VAQADDWFNDADNADTAKSYDYYAYNDYKPYDYDYGYFNYNPHAAHYGTYDSDGRFHDYYDPYYYGYYHPYTSNSVDSRAARSAPDDGYRYYSDDWYDADGGFDGWYEQ